MIFSFQKPSEGKRQKDQAAGPGKIPAAAGSEHSSQPLSACLRRQAGEKADGQGKTDGNMQKRGEGPGRQAVYGHGKAEKNGFLHGKNAVPVRIRLRWISVYAQNEAEPGEGKMNVLTHAAAAVDVVFDQGVGKPDTADKKKADKGDETHQSLRHKRPQQRPEAERRSQAGGADSAHQRHLPSVYVHAVRPVRHARHKRIRTQGKTEQNRLKHEFFTFFFQYIPASTKLRRKSRQEARPRAGPEARRGQSETAGSAPGTARDSWRQPGTAGDSPGQPETAAVPLFSEQPPSPPFPAVCVFLRTSVSGSALRAGSAFSLNRCVRLSPPCGL